MSTAYLFSHFNPVSIQSAYWPIFCWSFLFLLEGIWVFIWQDQSGSEFSFQLIQTA